MKKKIEISVKMHSFIKRAILDVSDDIYTSRLLLAGADSKGVIRDLIEVGVSDEVGCMFMTGATSEELAIGVADLAKRDLEPVAFIHIYDPFNAFQENPNGYREHIREKSWREDCGEDPRRYKHMFFIRASPDFMQVLRYNAKRKKGKHFLPLEEFDLQVVQ